MGPPGATGELELVPVATSVPSIVVLYRAEHVPMVRRLVLMGSPADLAETIAHRAFAAIRHHWDAQEDPLTAVRQLAVADVLSRFRPPDRAPTTSPPRPDAPPEWAVVAGALDPLAPIDRVARVLEVYDGLDDAALASVLPRRRSRSASSADLPPADLHLATQFAAAVADVTPPSRLPDLLGIHGDDLVEIDLPPMPRRRDLRLPNLDRRWAVVAVLAVALVGMFGSSFDADLPLSNGPDQELRTGPSEQAGVLSATQGSPQSSCPGADPVVGPGGTPLPHEGDTDPRHVAAVVATDRRAIIALNRGAVDARAIDRGGRVLRTGPNGVGRVRNIDGSDDRQIQVVISSAEHCPSGPGAWKGVPLVFTTRGAAEAQPVLAVSGSLADGTEWEVRDRPGHGLCASAGEQVAPCGAEAPELEQLAPVRVLRGRSGGELAFGHLPASASTARLEASGGELGPEGAVSEDTTFFALVTAPGSDPARVRFFDEHGAAVGAVPYPS